MTNPVTAVSVDSLFRSDEVIKIELRSDFDAIQKERTDSQSYHDGELIYYTPDRDPVRLTVRIMARGNFRLDPVNCDFPPLFVDFKKGEVANTIFRNQNRIKLVTPCQFEEDIIDEYTIYKLYNQVTDLSFNVRLVKVLYFDTGLNKKVFEKYSFFLEDKKHVAERNNATERDKFLTPFDLNRENFQKLSVFQYIIGNKDWYVSSRKNIMVLEPEEAYQGLYAVPFDFDFSGFVNAEYTKPRGVPEDLLADRRVYKGLCYTDEEFKKIFDFFRGLKPEFESIINNQKLIPKYTRRQILDYINNFYTIIDRNELFEQAFLTTCETPKDYNIVQ
jgi:hypothetical protein